MTQIAEQWVPLSWADNYEISNLGGVRTWNNYSHPGRAARPRLMRAALKDGYACINPRINGKAVHRLVHRLVLEAFVGPCPPGMEACHGNGVRDDNRLENLRWDTKAGNGLDKSEHGTAAGSHNGNSTLCEAGARLMRYLVGVHEVPWADAAAWFSVSKSSVARCVGGQTWKHVPMQK